jgi:Uma2 family endonuclease
MEPAKKRYSESEYLARERARAVRHEYVDGVEYAMAGASGTHNDLVLRLGVALLAALESKGCNARTVDQRVKPGAKYYYPDVVVYCGEPRTSEDGFDTLLDATAIIEVLSPGTEAVDRGEKFHAYRALPSFREYLLVDPRRRFIERFTRQDDGTWRVFEYGAGHLVPIEAASVSFEVDAVYRNVKLEPLVRIA